MPLPKLEDISDNERQRQVARQAMAAQVGRLASGAEFLKQQAVDHLAAQEQYKKNVVAQIRQEGNMVAKSLVKAGQSPDISLDVVEVTQGRWLNRDKTKTTRHGVVGGWILTPPRGLRYAPTEQNPHNNPRVKRSGFALGADGKIYKFRINEPVRRAHNNLPPLKLAAHVAKDTELVVDKQISHNAQEFLYKDQIEPGYGDPGFSPNGAPIPGFDDISIVHGLGIRQALGALNVRAGYGANGLNPPANTPPAVNPPGPQALNP